LGEGAHSRLENCSFRCIATEEGDSEDDDAWWQSGFWAFGKQRQVGSGSSEGDGEEEMAPPAYLGSTTKGCDTPVFVGVVRAARVVEGIGASCFVGGEGLLKTSAAEGRC